MSLSIQSIQSAPASSAICASIRQKKKFFWDQAKVINRHWLAANMNSEAYLGFNAFNTKKITGKDVIDFIEFRRRQARGEAFDAEFMAAVLAKPQS